jgi:mannose/cellobiose epimerase-like protein (N-acyl-D-glucosamine 2-epimerase family)
VVRNAAESALTFRRGELLAWLAQDACPLWSSAGVASDGGFEECLDADGKPLPMPHRLRVLPRQIYSFAQAEGLGSTVNVARIVRSGLVYLEDRYRRSDGLYRTLVSTSGNPLDDSALLYDHAFILLGYASACRVLGDIAHFESEAGKR